MPRGIKEITDAKNLEEYHDGKFIGQIKREHHVGLKRIREVLDREGLRGISA